MFPVYVNDGTQEVPDADIFYIIGKDGIYLRKKLGRLDAIVPVDKISTLGDVETMATYDLPPIPALHFAKVVSFFKVIYEMHKSEAIVLVHFDEENEKFKLQCPHQKVTRAGLDYIRTVTFPGYTKVCTIHSHSDMSAFHSGTDDKDEEDTDGLHITIGHLDWDDGRFDLSVSVVINGKRFMVEASDYIEGLTQVEVEEKSPHYISTWFNSYLNDDSEPDVKPGYKMNLPDSKMTFNKNWLDYVTVESVRRGYYMGGVHYGGGHRVHSVGSPHYKNNQKIIEQHFGAENNDEDAHDFNPCLNCVFSEHKLLQEVEDEDIDPNDVEGYDIVGGDEHNHRPITHENQLLDGGDEHGN